MTIKTKLDDIELKATLREIRGKTLDVAERIRRLLKDLAARAKKLPRR